MLTARPDPALRAAAGIASDPAPAGRRAGPPTRRAAGETVLSALADGRLTEAQILLSDMRGRYGVLGNRLVLLLQGAAASAFARAGTLSPGAAEAIRRDCWAALLLPWRRGRRAPDWLAFLARRPDAPGRAARFLLRRLRDGEGDPPPTGAPAHPGTAPDNTAGRPATQGGPMSQTLDRIRHGVRWRLRRLRKGLGQQAKLAAYRRLTANAPIGREARPTRARTSLFPLVALDLAELESQIIAQKGGPLLTLLQDRAAELPARLAESWPELDEAAILAMAAQNLRGGRRSDLPLTAQEARETAMLALGLTLDFDPEPRAALARLMQALAGAPALLAPVTKEESLVLAEAWMALGRHDGALRLIADAYGRYGLDGDREMMCLEANLAQDMGAEGRITPEAARRIRAEAIGGLFGGLPAPDFELATEAFDIGRLRVTAPPAEEADPPLVSILLTVWNGAATLPYALDAILNQTWRHIELIAIDDGSTDDTPQILAAAAARDPRVKVHRSPRSLGAYGARNLALTFATGAVITCHDADDWSHPQKIERQIRFLWSDPAMAACSSAWIRATQDLRFTRKSRHRRYVQKNPSSLMFRRTVLACAGNWDEVTVGADTEFEERLKLVYGRRAVRYLNEVLSFGLDHATSLSKESVWRGWLSPDLDAYHRAFGQWHAEIARTRAPGKRLQIAPRDAAGARAFPAPALLLRQPRPERFDMVMMTDFRLYGGSVLSVVEEIRAQARAGLTTAIHQIDCVSENITGRRSFNPEVNRLLQDGTCTLVGADWDFAAGACLMRFPPIFDFAPAPVPRVATPHRIMAVNTAPIEPNGEGRMYHTDRVIANMTATFGDPGIWAPIGPRIRAYVQHEVPPAILAPEDWVNIVDLERWMVRRTGLQGARPVVGRHSRDDKVKWPRDAETIRQVYLSDPSWTVRVMGGATCVTDLTGPLPGNVTVLPFNAVPVPEFLKTIDFFVYYDDPDRIEAFGRVFIEAIAAGCCVILPRYYQPVFGEACLYAEPHEVRDLVNRMQSDPAGFVAFVTRAQDIARERWSYATHIRRLAALGVEA